MKPHIVNELTSPNAHNTRRTTKIVHSLAASLSGWRPMSGRTTSRPNAAMAVPASWPSAKCPEQGALGGIGYRDDPRQGRGLATSTR